MRFSHCSEIIKNRQCFKIIRFSHCPGLPRNHEKPCLKIMRFLHCPDIMKICQNIQKSWDFHIAQKSWKYVKIFKNLGVTWVNGKSTFYTPTKDIPKTFSWFSPYLGGFVRNFTPALLPFRLTRGLGLGWGWLGPSLVSVLANAWAGLGIRGQPLHMTHYLHVLRSMP
jgi:hypothetical protein